MGGKKQPPQPADRKASVFAEDGRIGLVHGFIKKTQKTPPEDIALARKRMKEMKS